MLNKNCNKCKVDKLPSEFYKDSASSDGLYSLCKLCKKESKKLYKLNNNEKIKEYTKKYYNKNKEVIKQKAKTYRDENSEKVLASLKSYYNKNKDYFFEKHKKWVKKNPDRWKELKRKWSKERIETDPLYKFEITYRSRIKQAFKRSYKEKASKTIELLGCSIKDAMDHIQSQFQPGMTWKNNTVYGWHIDHIIPLSSATNVEELKSLCHYTNLQPLWAEENLKKSNKI